MDGCVVLGEKLHPARLPSRHVALCGEMLERAMVGPHLDRVTEYFGTPYLQGSNDCQQLLFMDWIIQFRTFKRARVVRDWPSELVRGAKGEDCPRAGVAGVRGDEDLIVGHEGRVDGGKAVGRHDQGFDGIEGGLMARCPGRERFVAFFASSTTVWVARAGRNADRHCLQFVKQ